MIIRFALSACIVLAIQARSGRSAEPLAVNVSSERVGRYEKIEFVVGVGRDYANPFDPAEVDLALLVESPGGERIEVPGFCCQDYRKRAGDEPRGRDWLYPDGKPVWKVRFAPDEPGRYTAVARLVDREGTRRSDVVRFECTPSDRKGFLRTSSDDPRFFAFSDGRPFFAIGQNLAFIGSGQYVDLAKAEEIFARLEDNGANFLRIWTGCEDWALAIEARKSVWGRSWQKEWPIVPTPDGDGAAGRKCVALGGKPLAVSPCNPVALLPRTRYLLTGRVRSQTPGRLEIRRNQASFDTPVAPDETNRWVAFRHELTTGDRDDFLGRITLQWQNTPDASSGGNSEAAYLDALSLREAAGGPELLWEADVNRQTPGFYNPPDCCLLDEVVESARRHGIYLQLCLLTRDLYMPSLKDASSPAYGEAIAHARNLLRYAVARWGYSTSVAVWEYFNELDPGLPSDRFYAELADYLDRVDPYRHPRTTSTWSPSAKDCRHPRLDVAQVHYYLRPDEKRLQDEVEAALDRVAFLREQAPAKPALVGEFGLATNQWGLSPGMKEDRELVHFHNALWASALSGGSGTVLFWWWDQLDRMDAYGHYRPLALFLEDVPFTTGSLKISPATAVGGELRVVGLQGPDSACLWLLDSRGAWTRLASGGPVPAEIKAATLKIEGLAPGNYSVQWWDTRKGSVIRTSQANCAAAALELPVPPFTADVACKIQPAY
jgi:hypothetical protein